MGIDIDAQSSEYLVDGSGRRDCRLLDAGNGASQLARQFVRYLRNCTVAKITGLSPDAQADFAKKLGSLLEKEGVALDAGGYRDAPPGLRIWCGATVDASDVDALTPWLDWAFETLASELQPA